MSVQPWFDRDVSDVAGLLAEEHVARTLLKKADLAASLRDVGGQLQGLASNAGNRFSEFSQNFGPQVQEFGGKAMEWLNEPNHQAVRQGLVGAGVGGLLGAGSQLFREPEERQYGSSAMHGALAGGALGGGLGLIQQNMGNVIPPASPASAAKSDAAAETVATTPAATTPAATAGVDQQIEELNKQIGEQTKGQDEAARQALRRAGLIGAGAGLGSGATAWAADNRPGPAILRGAKDLKDNAVGSKGTLAAAEALTRPLNQQPLTRAGFSAYFDPVLPGSTTSYETVPDLDNPLGHMLQGRTDLTPGMPGTKGSPVTTRTPGRFFADLDAPNKHIPGLTNAQVRDLYSRGRRWPTWRNATSATAAGLLPLAIAALSGYNSNDAQQQLATTLSGGKN